jgi:hypothetical protein
MAQPVTPGRAGGDTTPKKRLARDKADRVAALRRRIAKSEHVLKSLSVWPEPKRDAAEVLSATVALKGNLHVTATSAPAAKKPALSPAHPQ